MTVSVDKIKCKIYKKFLYNLETNDEVLVDAEIIGVSAYVGQPLTFHVLIEGHSIFSDIPIHALCKHEPIGALNKILLPHINCPDYNIDVFILNDLKSKVPVAYFKKSNTWLVGTYLFTVDFFKENELMHLLLLVNGQFAFVPNHKINWNNKLELPDYKKLKQNWSI